MFDWRWKGFSLKLRRRSTDLFCKSTHPIGRFRFLSVLKDRSIPWWRDLIHHIELHQSNQSDLISCALQRSDKSVRSINTSVMDKKKNPCVYSATATDPMLWFLRLSFFFSPKLKAKELIAEPWSDQRYFSLTQVSSSSSSKQIGDTRRSSSPPGKEESN